MNRPKPFVLATLFLALAFGPATAQAGEILSQSNFGSSFFSASPPCPVKKFPTFESVAPIPAIVDPFAQDLVPIFCQIRVSREGEGVKKAKGNFFSEVVIRDNDTGELEAFPVGSGSFRTNKDGFAGIDFEIPTDIFADGFESGDVSAWSYTRADFSNRKRADNTSMQCGKSSSSSR